MSSKRPNNNDDPWSSSDEEEDNDSDDENVDLDAETPFYSICSYCHTDDVPKFDTLALALEYDVREYGFDLLGSLLSSKNEDDFFEGTIVLINKARQFVKDNQAKFSGKEELGQELSKYLKDHKSDDDSDAQYYKPVLDDDSMLMCIDELCELKRQAEQESQADSNADAAGDCKSGPESDDKLEQLQAKISMLEEQLSRAKGYIAALANDDDDDSMSDDSRGGDDGDKKQASAKQQPNKAPDNDTYYFTSYSHTGIHETMLRDTVRTAAYEEAILSNANSLFRDKVVLDIGCGTGVLSLFCAKAGAKQVIAVDNSDIIKQARDIVELNGYSHVVTCVRGKCEDLIANNALPLDGKTVDIIVSEWMGYALFFETMLPSVMVARDALMTPETGSMFPNVAKIFIEGCNEIERLDYWNDVHGLNMTPMKERMVSELTQDAHVEVVSDANIVTDRKEIIAFDLNTCKDADLDFEVPFELHLRDGMSRNEFQIHSLVISFDIDFTVPNSKPVHFSTGCQSTPTHWKQTQLWFDPIHNCPVLNREAGDTMKGVFRMKRNVKNHRAIDMSVIWEVGRQEDGLQWKRISDGVLKRSLIA
jgi:predicted RNA methylase